MKGTEYRVTKHGTVHLYGGLSAHHDKAGCGTDDLRCRPVLVIDPDDRRQTDELTQAYEDTAGNDWSMAERMQRAVRSLVAPPKPDEPTNRYAVVSDGTVTWVRAAWANARPWNKIGTDVWAEYADIDAVRVLSEGVPS